MKLKNKLWISFGCIIAVPIILAMLFGSLLIRYQMVAIEYTYGVKAELQDVFPNTTKLIDRLLRQMQLRLVEKVNEEPEILEDSERWDAFCQSISNASMNVLLFREGELVYQSAELPQETLDCLLESAQNPMNEDETNYISSDNILLAKTIDIVFGNGDQGSIYVIVDIEEWIPETKAMLLQGVIAILFILVLTAALFTTWVYRSIIRPINTLKDATNQIKSGNLDFHIEADESDELGQLCTGFEEMRQRLKETSEEKIQFDLENKELISNISHDLRTPLTAIKGYVEGIMDGVADSPEKLNRYIKTIYNKAIDMDKLLDELTFYSKIDTNRIPYNFSKLGVTEYFDDCVSEVELELQAKGIEFQYSNYVDDSTAVIADPEQIKRVINNIISNSVKYFDKKKCWISMRVKDVGDFIQVEIEDNGRGIGQKELPYIFDRFYRTDSSRNSSKGGSGIGLSIVKKIMEDHNGKIWATSKEGMGTVMYFVLRKYEEHSAEELNEMQKQKGNTPMGRVKQS